MRYNLKYEIMRLAEMTNQEIAEEILSYRLRVVSLEAKLRKSEEESGERALLAFTMAETSDRMKLQLLLCGALRSPPRPDEPEPTETPCTPK